MVAILFASLGVTAGRLAVTVRARANPDARIGGRDCKLADARVGKFLDVDGVRLHYVESGTGAPLLLIHGNGTRTIALAPISDRVSFLKSLWILELERRLQIKNECQPQGRKICTCDGGGERFAREDGRKKRFSGCYVRWFFASTFALNVRRPQAQTERNLCHSET
jgi:hypothetical protein